MMEDVQYWDYIVPCNIMFVCMYACMLVGIMYVCISVCMHACMQYVTCVPVRIRTYVSK